MILMPDLLRTSAAAIETVRQQVHAACLELISKGVHVDTARLEAEWLLLDITGKSRAWLRAFDDTVLSPAEQTRFQQSIERRLKGEPLAYILGHKDFWSLKLEVNPAVLVPRDDTEILVEQSLRLGLQIGDAMDQPVVKVLELGTGSGAITCALASEAPEWQFTATDLSAEALAVARVNLTHHGIMARTTLLSGSWFDALSPRYVDTQQCFDLIVSNPPYIALGDPHLDAPALRHEPVLALSSGVDGLDSIRHIVANAARWLQPAGWLLLEHGYDQGPAVRQLMLESGFEAVATVLDLAGQPRVSLCQNSQCANQGLESRA